MSNSVVRVGRPYRLHYGPEESAKLTVDLPPVIKQAIVESAEQNERLLSEEVQLALKAWMAPAASYSAVA